MTTSVAALTCSNQVEVGWPLPTASHNKPNLPAALGLSIQLVRYALFFMSLQKSSYYTILCAEQSLEHKGTGTHLDLASAEQRLHQIIELVFLARPYLVDKWHQRSSRLGYRALSRLAEDGGKYRVASAYRWRIMRANPSLSDLGRLVRTWFAGAFTQIAR